LIDSEQQNTPEEIDRERWLEVQRKERRLLSVAAWVLLAGTVYFLLLNIIAIGHSAQKISYNLEIEKSLSSSSIGNAKLYMSWKNAGSAIQPSLIIDGRILVPTDSSAAILVKTSSTHQIDVEVPYGCKAGIHEGTLYTFRDENDNNLLMGHSVPVSVEISASIWNNWFILRDWLIFAFISIVIVYLFCVLSFPRPRGKIIFEDSLETQIVTRSRIPLKMRRSAWLMPWHRSSLSLRDILKKAGIPVPANFNAEIYFVYQNYAPYLLTFTRSNTSIFRFYQDQYTDQPLDINSGVHIGANESMDRQRGDYLYRLPGSSDFLIFYFENYN
jgi:hypothetical protein